MRSLKTLQLATIVIPDESACGGRDPVSRCILSPGFRTSASGGFRNDVGAAFSRDYRGQRPLSQIGMVPAFPLNAMRFAPCAMRAVTLHKQRHPEKKLAAPESCIQQ
jgi:hypothetical protein